MVSSGYFKAVSLLQWFFVVCMSIIRTVALCPVTVCFSAYFGVSVTKTILFKYTEIFTTKKQENFQIKIPIFFHISTQNIDLWYSLEPHRRNGSNEYTQSMFLSRNKKNDLYPVNISFII